MTVKSDVIILFHSESCPACRQLLSIWSNETCKSKDNVVNAMKKIEPNLTFISFEASENLARKKVPAAIVKFISWWPNIFYVPKDEWNNALKNPNYQISESKIWLFSGEWNQQTQKFFFNPRTARSPDQKGFSEWLSDIKNKGSNVGTSGSTSSEPLLVTTEQPKRKKAPVCNYSRVVTLRR